MHYRCCGHLVQPPLSTAHPAHTCSRYQPPSQPCQTPHHAPLLPGRPPTPPHVPERQSLEGGVSASAPTSQSLDGTNLGARTASLPTPNQDLGHHAQPHAGEVPRHGSPPHGSGSLSRVSREHKGVLGRASQELGRVSRKITDFVAQTAGGVLGKHVACSGVLY